MILNHISIQAEATWSSFSLSFACVAIFSFQHLKKQSSPSFAVKLAKLSHYLLRQPWPPLAQTLLFSQISNSSRLLKQTVVYREKQSPLLFNIIPPVSTTWLSSFSVKPPVWKLHVNICVSLSASSTVSTSPTSFLRKKQHPFLLLNHLIPLFLFYLWGTSSNLAVQQVVVLLILLTKRISHRHTLWSGDLQSTQSSSSPWILNVSSTIQRRLSCILD